MRKPTVSQLQAEIEALRKRVAELEARPAVVIHNHPPVHMPASPLIAPHTEPWKPYPEWKPGDVWLGVAVGAPLAQLWNGPRNPDGSCAPCGSATLTIGNGVLL